MNDIYTQHFTFIDDIEISLTQSILNEGDYVLELKSIETDYQQRIELTKDELLGIVELVKKFGLIQPKYIMSCDPYKEDGSGSSVGAIFSGPDYEWEIRPVPKAKVLYDCNLESNNILVLDRDWYTPGYRLWIRNTNGDKCELWVVDKTKNRSETIYEVIDVNNTKLWINAGAEVIADYIDPDTEHINS